MKLLRIFNTSTENKKPTNHKLSMGMSVTSVNNDIDGIIKLKFDWIQLFTVELNILTPKMPHQTIQKPLY